MPLGFFYVFGLTEVQNHCVVINVLSNIKEHWTLFLLWNDNKHVVQSVRADEYLYNQNGMFR